MADDRIRLMVHMDQTLRHNIRGLALELDISAAEIGKLALQYALRQREAFGIFARLKQEGRKPARHG